jgi:ribosomal protein L7/L12
MNALWDNPLLIVFAALVLLAIVASQRARLDLERRIRVLSRVDAKLDLLLQHAGINYDPYKSLPREVVEAVRRGEKIQAIKSYRKATGVGLREAKDAIEDIQRRAGA